MGRKKIKKIKKEEKKGKGAGRVSKPTKKELNATPASTGEYCSMRRNEQRRIL
jgi:hypothetical protein